MALLFEKPSLRTRVSFEAGMVHLGGTAMFLGDDVGFGKRESVADFGRVLAEACQAEEPAASAMRLQMESMRFLRAPVVVAVISRIAKAHVVPEWEQILSAGAACQNLVVASSSMGFGAQWITEWYAYSEAVRQALGLDEAERVAGFVYIGTPKQKPDERP